MRQTFATHTPTKERFCDFVLQYNHKANIALISKAYTFAEKAHSGQKRLSGETYFIHVVQTAQILTQWRMDTSTICAGLLHDTLEDTGITKKILMQQFGEEIVGLVEGVTKIENISFKSEEEHRAENIRRVLFASLKDIRVIFVKLADRLHNMRTLRYLEINKQKKIAKETLDTYVPIAYKLGMYETKSEIEDLALRTLLPDVYQELKDKIMKKKEEREKEIRIAIHNISDLLRRNNIKAQVKGRAKNFYSTYKKMKKKNLTVDQIRDLYGVRIVLNTVDNCYRALTLIHTKWKPLLKEFDDYIATPKPNMYRSIHTEIDMDGYLVEIQLRTTEMHHTAEEGMAAHWRYKETERNKKFDRRVSWIKQILEWSTESQTAKSFIEELKIDLFKNEIYVITPKGDPIPLPEDATPIDFAYRVHTNLGNRCVQAKINGNIVPLKASLKSGDVCEIITSKKAGPSRSWLSIAKASSTKAKIRKALNIHREKKKKEEGIIRQLHPINLVRNTREKILNIAKCCQWYEDDTIVGYKTKEGKINVHNKNCRMVRQLPPEKVIDLEMEAKKKRQNIAIQLEVKDRSGLFSDILNTFSEQNVKVTSITTRTSRNKIFVIFEISDKEKTEEIITVLKKIHNVISVEKSIIA